MPSKAKEKVEEEDVDCSDPNFEEQEYDISDSDDYTNSDCDVRNRDESDSNDIEG